MASAQAVGSEVCVSTPEYVNPGSGRGWIYVLGWIILAVICWPVAFLIAVVWAIGMAVKLCLHGTVSSVAGIGRLWRWLDRATGPQYEVKRRRRASLR